MKFGKIFFLCSVFYLSGSFVSAAEELVLDDAATDESVVAIYGAACENVKIGEAKSSLRVRATDKANFDAVSSLSELIDAKQKFDPHDFNVLVYDLVDNHVEDLAVRTTAQDEKKLCVEVTGYLRKDNIANILQKASEGRTDEDFNDEQTLSLENDARSQETSEEMPHPQDTSETLQNLSDTPIPSAATEVRDIAETEEDKTKIYVEPTVFFNETQSETHAQHIKDILQRSSLIDLLGSKDQADFIVRSNVLRAKIDPINSNTSRLQMVVSLTIENTADKTSFTEHQNRFVLFSSEDDEQKVASSLMRKLFEKATESVLPRLEKKSKTDKSNSSLPQMITPAKTKPLQAPDAS